MHTYKKLRDFLFITIMQKTIQEGLLMTLPFIIIGAIALALKSIPFADYQEFIKTVADGQFNYILTTLHMYTIQIIPFILIFTLSIAFARTVSQDTKTILFYPIIAFMSHLILLAPHRNLLFFEVFNSSQTFSAILSTIFSCTFLHMLLNWKYTSLKYYIKTHNHTFNIVYQLALPACIVLITSALLHLLLTPDVKNLSSNFYAQFFAYLGNNFFSTALCVFFEHLYWFIGINGSTLLDVVTINQFEVRLLENMADLAAGITPQQIYTKTFLDVFVGIGGSGAIWSLIICIFCFAKLPHTRRIATIALFPAMLNISEILILGLPIICNIYLLIPFIFVPLLNMAITSVVMQIGLVPVTIQSVEWTTPPLLNAYVSTGSLSAVILQITLVIIGTFAYRPFILKYEANEDMKLKQTYKKLIDEIVASEKIGQTPKLLNDNSFSDLARLLSSDLHQALEKKELKLFYQPQINHNETIYGGEALLRWHHPQFGYVYPPLIIFLAKENNFLDEIGMYVIEQTCQDLEYLNRKLNHPIKLSVNVAPPQLYNKNFCRDVRIMLAKYNFGNSILAFEITEQIALSCTMEIMNRLNDLKKMGIMLSMDDFGMGHSSVMYLQNSDFDIVKLDGNLTKKVLTSERSVDIISAITQLGKKFNFKVIAEYVETNEQRDKLAELGCYIYQGWLYSQAIPIDVFLRYLQNKR